MVETSPEMVAERFLVGLSLLVRRIRQARDERLSLPEIAALGQLDQHGPSTVTALARIERISPQSLGATIAALEERRLVRRSADPDDGRQALIALTKGGRDVLTSRRNQRLRHLARAIAAEFDDDERSQLLVAAPLLERLARAL